MTLLQVPRDISPFGRALLETVFISALGVNRVVALSEAKTAFNEAAPQLRYILYDELVQRGFFPAPPPRTRIFWKEAGVVLVIVAIVAGLVGLSSLSDIAPAVWMSAVALLILGLVVAIVARVMPRKTVAGAEAAAKWRAFQRYLEHIDQFE